MDGLIKDFRIDKLRVLVYETREQMGRAAYELYRQKIGTLLASQERVRAIFAAAHSQDDFLRCMAQDETLDFGRIEAFHMDEYIGLQDDAPQKFSAFLTQAIFSRRPFGQIHLLRSAVEDPEAECRRYAALLQAAPMDIVSLGIGENGHIAFNDPHVAQFDDPQIVKITTLDEPCRQQQVNDGEFASIDRVPRRALTLTIPALLACRTIVGIVPLDRKAKAVRDALYGPVAESCPASVLRTHDDATLLLDRGAACMLDI